MTSPEPNLLLIGLRGSGKSTLARALGERQGRTSIDLDDEVRAMFPECESIAQIFETRGEPAFREAEARALEQVMRDRAGAIVALGGGTPTAPGAADLISAASARGAAQVVYLRCNPDVLRERLECAESARDDRPSLTGANPLDEIETIFAQRDALYRSLATCTLEDEDDLERALEALADWTTW